MASGTPKALEWAEKQLGRLAGLFAIVGACGIVVLMLITVVAVFWRYILNDPIYGIEDLSTVTLTVVVAASVVFCGRHNAHVSVNIISYFFRRRTTRYTDLVGRLCAVGIISTACYALFKKGGCGLLCGDITNNLSIEYPPFYYTLGAAIGLYAAMLIVQLLIGLAHWGGEDPGEVKD